MQMNLFAELNNLSFKYRFYPKKGSGLHFILDEKLLDQIIFFSELKKSDKVIELLAGEFFLARKISFKAKLIPLEERKDLIKLLESEFQKTKIHSLDFLSKTNANKCVSFLPLNASNSVTKLFFLDLELIVLLLQRDLTEKMLAEPGFSEYSFLSVLTQAFFELKESFTVKPTSFFPPVSSDFVLIKLKKKKTKIKDKKLFAEFVKALFRFKNKSFLSALNQAIPLMDLSEKTKQKLLKKSSEIEFNEKVYLMETEDFTELFLILFK